MDPYTPFQPTPQPPKANKVMLLLTSILLVISALFFAYAIFFFLACFTTCGLAGGSYATKMLLMSVVVFLIALFDLIFILSSFKKSQKSINTSKVGWIIFIILNCVLVIANWNSIMLSITGNELKYQDGQYERHRESKEAYLNTDCKTVTDMLNEVDCIKSKTDKYVNNDFYQAMAADLRCSELQNPYNFAMCNFHVFKGKLGESVNYCSNLNLEPKPKPEDSFSIEYPYFLFTPGANSKEEVRLNCLGETLFENEDYYNNVYIKIGLSNEYFYGEPKKEIPEWELTQQRDICLNISNSNIKDICFARAAYLARYKAGFGSFCELISDDIKNLKNDCIVLREKGVN